MFTSYSIPKIGSLPFDLITGNELYLYIGYEKIDINFVPYFHCSGSDGVVSFCVEIDADKQISLSFDNRASSISLGEVLLQGKQ